MKVAVLVAGFLLILLGALPVLVFASSAAPPEQTCINGPRGSVVAATASTSSLDARQLNHAATIIQVGSSMHVPQRGIVIALATALQESRLRIYANDGLGGDLDPDQRGVGASLGLPHEAVGTDHGSLGLFQQQWPWWGSMRTLMDPAGSARLFFRALLQIPRWRQLPATVAAQAVQRSAYPDAYADDVPLARTLLADLGNGVVGAAADCSVLSGSGTVRFPLPPSSSYVDQRNFGHTGGRWSSLHTGTDLSAACGTPVLAATAGTVHIRTDQPWAGRWLVTISTGPGKLTTWYAHMRRVLVRDGTVVRAGETIGEVGDLGNATGCHLHFEVHPHGGSIYQDPVNPTIWLRKHVRHSSRHRLGQPRTNSQTREFVGPRSAG